jgi:aspartokinase
MAGENELVTVFRSADADAEEQAGIVQEILARANIQAEIADDSAPGVPAGVFEVRAPAARQAEAERLIEAQRDTAENVIDLSHDLDMASVFISDAAEAEMLATQIRSILDSHNIPAVMVSGSVFPNLPFEVRVPKSVLQEARDAIAEAEAAGPAAADEAELESESEPGSSVELP